MTHTGCRPRLETRWTSSPFGISKRRPGAPPRHHERHQSAAETPNGSRCSARFSPPTPRPERLSSKSDVEGQSRNRCHAGRRPAHLLPPRTGEQQFNNPGGRGIDPAWYADQPQEEQTPKATGKPGTTARIQRPLTSEPAGALQGTVALRYNAISPSRLPGGDLAP